MVSVIIPAYRCADTVTKAIDSALAQEVPVEIWVINDKSPDDLDRVMKKYEKVREVRYLHNFRRLGAGGTRNYGCQLATGEWVAFLDADDWWEKGKLQKQLDLLSETGDVLCCTARELVTPEGELTGHVIPVQERITYEELLKHNQINCSSVLVKREAMLEFPMKHENSHEDYIAWICLLRKYRTACAVNEPLLKYRLTGKGKSGGKLKSAWMTYTAYRYSGFGRIASFLFFCRYAVNGVKKYRKAWQDQNT